MRMSRSFAIGLVHRVMYAKLLAAFVWYLAVVPYAVTPIPRAIHHPLLLILDLPLAPVSTHLPSQLKTIDAFSSARQPEYDSVWQYLHVHLRTAVPIYVVVFYVPALVQWVRRRVRRRQGPGK